MFQEMLMVLLQAVLAVAVPVISGFVIKFLNCKTIEIKKDVENDVIANYLDEVNLAVATAVMYTQQTYVDSLKKSDKFSKENQKEALDTSVGVARNLLTQEALKFLEKTYGDIKGYLETKIEARVCMTK